MILYDFKKNSKFFISILVGNKLFYYQALQTRPSQVISGLTTIKPIQAKLAEVCYKLLIFEKALSNLTKIKQPILLCQ
jgi:hypothetical protein